MQLRELNLSNSILNSELRELEAMSPKWARLHYRVLPCYSSNNTLCGTECTCKSATSKYGMHLQKCNLTIWNSPLWAPSLEENQLIIPVWTVLRKALVEGECEFWDCLRPGFAPNPFLFLGSLVFFPGWYWLVLRPRWRRCFCLLQCIHVMNA